MPPKNRFCREEIVTAALEIVRAQGMEGVTARAVARKLGASPKVIFGLFPDMASLKASVIETAQALYQQRILDAMAQGRYPPYKASGMAYIDFAREEKVLFRLLFMRDRTGETVEKDARSLAPILAVVRENLGLSEEEAMRFHLQMWLCVHGIAAMIATGYLDWDEDYVSRTLTDIYTASRERVNRNRAREE